MKHKTVVIGAILMLITSSALWSQRDYTPVSRLGHSMVTLPDGRVMMFGGKDVEGTLFNDLHAFEESGWAPITPPAPHPSCTGGPLRTRGGCHVYLRWSGRNRIA